MIAYQRMLTFIAERNPPSLLQVSLCNEPMRELSNPGASGSIFYLTNDDEFILKTVR